MLKLWMNPLRPVEENLEVADGEIDRLNDEIASLKQQLADSKAGNTLEKTARQQYETLLRKQAESISNLIEQLDDAQRHRYELVAWELFFDNGDSNGFTKDKSEAAEFGENKEPLYARKD